MSRWVVFRSPEHAALLTLRLRTKGRWLSPPILATSLESAIALTPSGSVLVSFL